MMFSFLLFFGIALLLSFEAKLLLRLVAHNQLTRWEQWALGFPLSAFLNALLFFVLTVFKIPLTLAVVYGAHGLIVALLWFFSRSMVRTSFPSGTSITSLTSLSSMCRSWKQMRWPLRLLITLLFLSLSIKLFYAFSHAVLLPSYYFDTVSQWNMRARISYEDHAIAFDLDESRGMSKPQYPILLHALQITFMLPQVGWLDRVANSATFLLTLTSFGALFLLLGRRSGLFALSVLTAMLMVPLLSIHTGQGHGDIHVIEYLLLSALLLSAYADKSSVSSDSSASSHSSLLLLSALFVAAAAWVKQEGFFFGVLLWLLLIGSIGVLWKRDWKELLMRGALPAGVLGSLWTIFLIMHGLPLSPHGTEFLLGFHREALFPMLQALFSFGSFGIFFFVVPLLIALSPLRRTSALLPLSWGISAFAATVFLYLLTPNVAFLLNYQTFHRTMLIPLSLLTLSCALLFWETPRQK